MTPINGKLQIPSSKFQIPNWKSVGARFLEFDSWILEIGSLRHLR